MAGNNGSIRQWKGNIYSNFILECVGNVHFIPVTLYDFFINERVVCIQQGYLSE